MNKLLAHFMLSKILFLLCLIIAAPLWYPATRLASALEAGPQQNIIAWAIRMLLLLLVFGLYWLSKRMSHHMTIHEMTFGRGVMEGFHDVRLHLTFLPLVGHLFVNQEDKRKSEQDRRD
jgi:hypothetical protein